MEGVSQYSGTGRDTAGGGVQVGSAPRSRRDGWIVAAWNVLFFVGIFLIWTHRMDGPLRCARRMAAEARANGTGSALDDEAVVRAAMLARARGLSPYPDDMLSAMAVCIPWTVVEGLALGPPAAFFPLQWLLMCFAVAVFFRMEAPRVGIHWVSAVAYAATAVICGLGPCLCLFFRLHLSLREMAPVNPKRTEHIDIDPATYQSMSGAFLSLHMCLVATSMYMYGAGQAGSVLALTVAHPLGLSMAADMVVVAVALALFVMHQGGGVRGALLTMLLAVLMGVPFATAVTLTVRENGMRARRHAAEPSTTKRKAE